jgi:hypothetical protein
LACGPDRASKIAPFSIAHGSANLARSSASRMGEGAIANTFTPDKNINIIKVAKLNRRI